MTMFVSSAWGFEPERWSALGFTNKAVRDRLQRQWREGDRMLVVGTKGSETPLHQQGRLLGIVDVTRRETDSWRLVHPDLIAEHERNGSRGKWGFGMPYRTAERFEEPLPEVNSVLPRIYADKLGMAAATGYLELTLEEEQRVSAYPRHHADVYQSSAAKKIHGEDDWRRSLNRLSKGPPPTPKTVVVNRSDGPAALYVMRFEGGLSQMLGKSSAEIGPRQLYKVGWAFDPVRRLKAINSHMPVPDRCGWRLEDEFVSWTPDANSAYVIEQRVLAGLRRWAHRGEMVLCVKTEVRSAIVSALGFSPSSVELAAADLALGSQVMLHEDDGSPAT